ncbi:MAG: ABC transporter permease [Chryseolinea sp.]
MSYTIINVLGLALGLSCAIIIFAIVRHHLSFDQFHAERERIYRLVTEQHRDQISYQASVPNRLGKVFREDYTFAEMVGRIATFNDVTIALGQEDGMKKFKEHEAAFAEVEFFEIFNYPLSQGDFRTALKESNSAIITETIAKKYFGNDNAIGKSFRLDNKVDFIVTGVLKPLPENTDLKTEIFFSYSTLKSFNEWFASDDSWGGISSQMKCFVRLQPGVSTAEVEAVFPAYVKKFRQNSKNVHHYKLQPLAEVHFDAKYNGAMEKSYLWVLSAIGFFLLLTACVNFVNLATAQATYRSKEVGIRKVLGSLRKQLFWQFMLETGFITFISTLLALAIANAALPLVSNWLKSSIGAEVFTQWPLISFVVALFVSVTILSGIYPGLILAGFKPVTALKGKLGGQYKRGINTRRSLIVTQFSITQLLVIALIVIVSQIGYIKQTDLGFDKDAIVMIPTGTQDEKMTTLKNQYNEIPGVEKVSLCFTAPSAGWSWSTSFKYDNRAEDEAFSIDFKGGDENYLSTFNLELVAGRNVEPSDSAREFIVNETFVRKMSVQKPEDILGYSIASNDMKGPIIGVVKDFHDQSLHQEIKPVFISTEKAKYNYYAVKLNRENMKSALAGLESSWSKMYPAELYDYAFLDQSIAEYYETEETMPKLIQAFAAIAILIGCMGLFGMVSFMATNKTKEIGIRKVLGGSVVQMIWIFGKEISTLILISFLFAAPVSWWLMNRWLENFEYKVNFGAWIFIAAISVTGLIAIFTVGYHAVRAAAMNPVDSLRTE